MKKKVGKPALHAKRFGEEGSELHCDLLCAEKTVCA